MSHIDRRQLFQVAAAAAVAPRGHSAVPPGGRMKLGTQHGSSDEILKVLAAFGVNNICSTLPSAKLDEAWSVNGLKRLRERVESHGIKLECVPLPLSSHYITKSENPNIMLGKSPERDREIDTIRRNSRGVEPGAHRSRRGERERSLGPHHILSRWRDSGGRRE